MAWDDVSRWQPVDLYASFRMGDGVQPVAMGARTMKGWLDVDLAKVARRAQLERWVGRGVAFARTLPPK